MSRADLNPFRSERVTALPFLFLNGNWDEILARLDDLNGRGAIVGPCGSGKTTFLEALCPQLESRGYEVHFARLNRNNRALPRDLRRNWRADEALVLDGAEQLSPWNWRVLRWQTREAGIFVVSTHRAGRLPLWLRFSTSPALLTQILAELGEKWPREEIERLHRAHDGNLRLVLLELYDRAAREMGALS